MKNTSISIYPKLSQRLTNCTCYGSGEDFMECVSDIENLWELGQLSEEEYTELSYQIKYSKEAMVKKIKQKISDTTLALKNTSQQWEVLGLHLKQLNFELTTLLPPK